MGETKLYCSTCPVLRIEKHAAEIYDEARNNIRKRKKKQKKTLGKREKKKTREKKGVP